MANSSFYNPNNGIYTSPRPPINFPSDPSLSMYSFFFRDIDSFPDRPALIDANSDGQTLTFRQLRSAVCPFAASLSRLGIRKGDVVLIFSPNSLLFPISFLSIVSLGAIATTVNPHYTVPELKQQVLDSGTKLVLTVPDLLPKASSLNLPIVLLAKNTNADRVPFPTFYDLVENQSAPAEFTPPRINLDDTAALLYSSGTTGPSKGVILTHRNFICTALMSGQDLTREPPHTFLCFLPMFHIFGLSVITFAQLARGSTVVVMKRFEMELMLRSMERCRVSYLYAVPPVMTALAKRGKVAEYDLSSLRRIAAGAAPLGKDVMEEVSEIFPHADIIQVDKFPNASYKGYATYEEALIEWEKHTLAHDSASSSRPVQTSVYAQEQRYPVSHNLDVDKEKLGETSIFSIYAFVLGSLFTILVFLVCIVAVFVGFFIAKNM